MDTIKTPEQIISTLTPEERVFIKSMHFKNYGILRMFLSKEEIKTANGLVKKGALIKGKSDEKNGTTAYFFENRIYNHPNL